MSRDTWTAKVAGSVLAALQSTEYVGVIIKTNDGNLEALASILEDNGARDIRPLQSINSVAATAPERAIRAAATHETVTKVLYDGVVTITDREDS